MNHYNLRDIGGMKTRSGQTITKNLIFRSANTDKLKIRDIRYLESLHIETIIDLRPESEQKRKKHPPSLPHTITVPIAITEKIKTSVQPYLMKKNVEEKIINIVNSVYYEMVNDFQLQIYTIFNLLLEQKKYPFLIHCRAGKDRTGLIIALILMLLDVDREIIINDYLSSNEYIIPYIRRILRPLKILSFGLFPSRNIEIMLMARPQYIQTIFDTISKEYNGIEKYLLSCGISKAEQQQIIDKLIERK